eukprot:COSAG02_NODE_50159_length_322_cov_0.883408_2_plen_38_part_01
MLQLCVGISGISTHVAVGAALLVQLTNLRARTHHIASC